MRDRPFIIIEVLPVYEESNVERLTRQNELEKDLKEIGYTILRVVKNPNDTFKEFELIKSIEIHSDIDLSDYVFIPEEKLNLVFEKNKH